MNPDGAKTSVNRLDSQCRSESPAGQTGGAAALCHPQKSTWAYSRLSQLLKLEPKYAGAFDAVWEKISHGDFSFTQRKAVWLILLASFGVNRTHAILLRKDFVKYGVVTDKANVWREVLEPLLNKKVIDHQDGSTVYNLKFPLDNWVVRELRRPDQAELLQEKMPADLNNELINDFIARFDFEVLPAAEPASRTVAGENSDQRQASDPGSEGKGGSDATFSKATTAPPLATRAVSFSPEPPQSETDAAKSQTQKEKELMGRTPQKQVEPAHNAPEDRREDNKTAGGPSMDLAKPGVPGASAKKTTWWDLVEIEAAKLKAQESKVVENTTAKLYGPTTGGEVVENTTSIEATNLPGVPGVVKNTTNSQKPNVNAGSDELYKPTTLGRVVGSDTAPKQRFSPDPIPKNVSETNVSNAPAREAIAGKPTTRAKTETRETIRGKGNGLKACLKTAEEKRELLAEIAAVAESDGSNDMQKSRAMWDKVLRWFSADQIRGAISDAKDRLRVGGVNKTPAACLMYLLADNAGMKSLRELPPG